MKLVRCAPPQNLGQNQQFSGYRALPLKPAIPNQFPLSRSALDDQQYFCDIRFLLIFKLH